MCDVCGPVMQKIKQQERDDGTNDDPLTRDQDMLPGEQRPASVASVSSHVDEQSQLYTVQAVQTRLIATHHEQLMEHQKKA